MNCPDCGCSMNCIEYSWNHPDHYDGISEWSCRSCKVRIGRWSGRQLEDDEFEAVYGKVGSMRSSYKYPRAATWHAQFCANQSGTLRYVFQLTDGGDWFVGLNPPCLGNNELPHVVIFPDAEHRAA